MDIEILYNKSKYAFTNKKHYINPERTIKNINKFDKLIIHNIDIHNIDQNELHPVQMVAIYDQTNYEESYFL